MPTIGDLGHRRRFFHLAVEPWIPVQRRDIVEKVGLSELFEDAHRIDALAIVDPLDRMAVWRFLIAVAQLIADTDPDLRARIGTDAGFDPAVVQQVLGDRQDRLWLVHPDHPFAQNLNLSVVDPDTTVDIHGLGALLLDVPGGSTKAWFTRPLDAPASLTPPAAAVALLARWFYSPPGNSPLVTTPRLGVLKRSEGGRALWGPRDLTHMVRVGPHLFATLGANLTYPAGGTIALFDDRWLAEDGFPAVAADPLLAATVTGTGALLVDDDSGSFSHVAVGPAPLAKEAIKEIMVRTDPGSGAVGWQDPHMTVVRSTRPARDGSAKTEDHRVMLLASGGWRFLHQFTAQQLDPNTTAHVLGIVRAANLRYPTAARSARSLDAVTIAMGGSTSGPVFEQVAHLTLDTDLFVTDSAKATETHDTLDLVYGDDGATSALRVACAIVTGGFRSQAYEAVHRRAHTRLLTSVDRITEQVITTIAESADSPALTDDDLEGFAAAVWRAAIDAFDAATSQLRTASAAARLADARSHLTRRRYHALKELAS